MKENSIALVSTVLALSLPLALFGDAGAAEENIQRFTLKLGDHHFTPSTIEVVAGRPVEITLVNEDALTPHNLTLEDESAGLAVDQDVKAGASVTVVLTPTVAGTYAFYCNKKLLFVKSHREKGMEGLLVVTDGPETPVIVY